MRKRSKRFRKAAESFDREKLYAVDEAVDILGKAPKTKFDETVEISIHTGLDPKKTDQSLRGSVALPRGLGKATSVLVFAEGDKAEEATKAGAEHVGGPDLVKKVEGGFLDFDVAVSTPAMMRLVGKLGKVLGPQGKMPSPKAGTVTDSIGEAVREFQKGRVEYRLDDGGNVHAPVGKRSFAKEALLENFHALLDHMKAHKPQGAKGALFESATLSSTMGPGIRLNPAKL